MGRIAAFDLSLTDTGWATIRDGAFTGVGSITTSFFGVKRLKEVTRQIASRIAADCDVVVVEGLSMGSQSGKALERAGLFYAVLSVLADLPGVLVLIVPPATLKKFVSGKGNAQKSDMKMHAFKRFGIENSNDNQVDAICLAYFGAANTGSWKPPTADMLATAQKVKAFDFAAK